MRLMTWNINSVRLRMDLLLRLIDEAAPDVICLQETKVVPDSFPLSPLVARGYRFNQILGMKSYNGVAILSRLPVRQQGGFDWCGRADCRHAFIELACGTEIHCLYIPAGGDIPDPQLNDKFAHKLAFLEALTAWWPQARSTQHPLVLAGDFNIAPLEQDVWSHKDLLDVVSHTPLEVEKLAALQNTLDWVDTMRHFIPATEKLYSWWSYRARDWELSDRGRRLDHIWVTPPLRSRLVAGQILRAVRGWEPKPSDHVPVVLDLADS